jgi:hypothetical protein
MPVAPHLPGRPILIAIPQTIYDPPPPTPGWPRASAFFLYAARQIRHNPSPCEEPEGGRVDTRLMLRSILVAVGLTVGLAVIFAIAILLVNRTEKGGDGISSGTGSGTDSGPCQFSGASPMLTVYQAPITDATQQEARLSGSDLYLVSQTHGQYLLIQLRDGRTAWADKRTGMLEGNCNDVPVDDTPLTGFPTLCTFTNTTSVPLYDNSKLTGAIGSVAPGIYPLIGINQNRYYLYLDANQGGWVLGSMGLVQGNCMTLPARPG